MSTRRYVTEEVLKKGVSALCDVDPDFGRLVEQDGVPPLWTRPPGFPTLVHIMLEQQVSLSSARATYDRLREVLPQLTPANFVKLGDEQLRAVGFSRQKTRYVRLLSRALLENTLSLEQLPHLEDDEVRRALMEITGIGRWTADVYLLMALRRPDIWPTGDLALVKAVMTVKQLESRPDAGILEAIAAPWRPWRSVAARVLWNHYLIHRHTKGVRN